MVASRLGPWRGLPSRAFTTAADCGALAPQPGSDATGGLPTGERGETGGFATGKPPPEQVRPTPSDEIRSTCFVLSISIDRYAESMTVTHEPRPIRVVVLCRVSTGTQLEGYGLDVQEKDCRNYARTHNMRIVRMCRDEGVTGKAGDDERPGLAEALQMLTDGKVDALLAPNLDRLARHLTQQEAILSVVWAHGKRFFTADRGEHLPDDDDDPMRTFVRQVMGAAAQLERGLIVKRLKSGRRQKAESGGYATGSPPYGQRVVDHQLIEHPQEAAVLRQMRAWAAEGVGVRAIARRLNDAGVPAKRGGRWHPSTVARLVDSRARADSRRRSASARAADREREKLARAGRVLGRVT